MPKQQINAGAKSATEGLCLPPGRILQQVAGTIAWGPDGTALGIVGRDVRAEVLVELDDGTVRPLTPAEARAYKRWLA